MEYEIEITEQFNKWHSKIKDKPTASRLVARLVRVQEGNFGDSKQISKNLFELRFAFGGGLRVYYTIKGSKIVLLLCGGNKSTQSDDISQARRMLDQLK